MTAVANSMAQRGAHAVRIQLSLRCLRPSACLCLSLSLFLVLNSSHRITMQSGHKCT